MPKVKKDFYEAKYDLMFKAIFLNPDNRDLLKLLLKSTINKDVEIEKVLSPEIPKHNIHIKGKALDVIVRDKNNDIYNIEVNLVSDDYIRIRNAAYIFTKFGDEVKESENYDNFPNIIQINLSFALNKNYPEISKYELIDKNNKKKFTDKLQIYEFNIAKIKQKGYNNISSRFLSALDANKEELSTLCKGDEKMEKFEKVVNNLNSDEEMIEFLSAEKEELIINTIKSRSEKQGILKGEKEKENLIIKNMLKQNLDVDTISKYTDVPIEKVIAIKEGKWYIICLFVWKWKKNHVIIKHEKNGSERYG